MASDRAAAALQRWWWRWCLSACTISGGAGRTAGVGVVKKMRAGSSRWAAPFRRSAATIARQANAAAGGPLMTPDEFNDEISF